MAGEEFAVVLLAAAVALSFFYAKNKEQDISREYLAEMKEKFFPELLENLKAIANSLETGSRLAAYSKVLDEKLSKTLLWQFEIRFPKLNKRLKELQKNLSAYDEGTASLSKGEETAKFEGELANMRLTLKQEVTSLIKEIESLMWLEKLPPRRSTGFGS